jgi:hypothetical protein
MRMLPPLDLGGEIDGERGVKFVFEDSSSSSLFSLLGCCRLNILELHRAVGVEHYPTLLLPIDSCRPPRAQDARFGPRTMI